MTYSTFTPKLSLFIPDNVEFRKENVVYTTTNEFNVLSYILFSSPEHKVLMVSFCDRPMSSVRRPSCVVHNFFKHLLLLNHWSNLDEAWQGCFLDKALPKFLKRLNSTQNSCCHGNQKEKIAKSLKIFFSETRRHRALIFGVKHLLVNL